MEYAGEWDWFIKKIEIMSHIDLKAYKRPQMERRINSFMRSVNASDYKDFINILSKDKVVYRKFIEHLTINVSEFFRNTPHWDIMEKEIIPLLYKQQNKLRVWSAGSSTGEEPYSLAMMFKEKFSNRIEKILATDIDNEVLDKASLGIYTQKSIQTLPDNYRKKYIINEGDYYRISNEIQKNISFQRHDLLKDAFQKNMDLILCRNVVIYFTEETKQKLYRRFFEALRPGGVLFIGSTEQIFQPRDIGFKSIATFFYQKV